MVSLHLILAASWGDVRDTLPFMAVPEKSGVVTLGGLPLRKKLVINVMRQLEATLEQLQGGNIVGKGLTQDREHVTNQSPEGAVGALK